VQQATQLNYLAWVHFVPPADPKSVLRYATEALELATRSGAAAQVAYSHAWTATALREFGRLDEAVTQASRSAEGFQAIGDTDAYVQALGVVGNLLRDQGRPLEALEQYNAMLALTGEPETRALG
jgi:tetratricopeptide (TPR) repeat protein